MKESTDPISTHLPKEGWFKSYIDFTGSLEACSRFAFFASCCVMGAAINNKVWIQRGDPELLPKLFPNLWVILLAPPGRGHKTATINMAVNCLTEACEDVRILANKLTPEYLVKALSTPTTANEYVRIGPADATGLITAPELSVFFGKQQYNMGLVSLITDLYDYRKEWKSATIGRGGETLYNNCISVLGGSTPDWLLHMLPQDAFTGGFMSRFVMVEMPTNYFKKVTFPMKPNDAHWVNIVNEFTEVSRMEGEIDWGEGSKEIYGDVYENCTPTGEAQVDAYREREPEQILKTSMLIALSNHRMTIYGRDVERARDIIHMLQRETNPRIERLTTNPRMQLIQDIQDLLKIYGELNEEELLKKIYRTLSQGEKQFYEAISIMRKTKLLLVKGSAKDGWIFCDKGGGKK